MTGNKMTLFFLVCFGIAVNSLWYFPRTTTVSCNWKV